jgi:cation diffusion facilitator CzcD-associated flavoprotein CzcO
MQDAFYSRANDTVSEFVRGKIREIVTDPAVAELLAPKDHPFFTKRPPLENGYYEAFNRDNVTLLDARAVPIEEITPDGVRTGEQEYIQHLNAHDLDVAEPAQEAEDKWVGHHNEVAAATLLLGTDSWWVGANIPGKPRTLYPYVGGVGPFRAICQDVAEKGYEGLVLTRH